jgi:SAM-dependent MidA family methyltransferase
MNIKQKIISEIQSNGAMPIDRYMELSNTHYYSTRDPLGADGDFTTAPEISQIFGEIIAIWTIEKWVALGSPAEFALVELGAGRGTLMADLLRAARVMPVFQPQIHIVEISPILREKQRAKLTRHPEALAEGSKILRYAQNDRFIWHEQIPKLNVPTIIIANEFFDALPIKQFSDGVERKITLENGTLKFTLPAKNIVEASPISEKIMTEIAANYSGGIIIDYGYIMGSGDTFQALQNHKYVNPLENCGEADLTAHVNFSRLAEICGGRITTQGEFLLHYGGAIRAKKLGREADFARLVSPEQMGELFKVLTF